MLPYDAIRTDAQPESGQAHLINGWKSNPYPLLKLDKPIPWALEKPDLRSWNYMLHAMNMLECVLHAHSKTGEAQYLEAALSIALDWVKNHHDKTTGISPMAWYDMAVGMRAYRLAYIFQAAEAAGLLDAAARDLLHASLERHREYLQKDENIKFVNNHGLFQIAGQLAMARRFMADSEPMRQAFIQGRERLFTIVRLHFCADGIHKEHSPVYHQITLEALQSMVKIGLVDSAELRDLCLRSDEALSWFALPNQHCAPFGDSDYSPPAMKTAEDDAERRWSSEAMRCMATAGKLGRLPADESVLFPEGGYFVARRPGPGGAEAFGGYSYLAQIACHHSDVHKHADDLSFIWFDRGSNLLVDAGKCTYRYDSKERNYAVSTRAHNTLEFDDRDYDLTRQPYGNALKSHVKMSSGIIAAESGVTQFETTEHSRVLIFQPGQWLLVFDWFSDRHNTAHTVKQWFHLAPELNILQDGNSFTVPVSTSGQPLRFAPLLTGIHAHAPVKGEDTGGVLQGWISPAHDELQPNHAFCYSLAEQRSTGALATLCAFSDMLSVLETESRCGEDGRTAQFSWRDDSGWHTVRLLRVEGRPLQLEYSMAIP